MNSNTPPPGWYSDPSDPNAQRWWDGSNWGEQAAPPAPAAPPSGVPGGYGDPGVADGPYSAMPVPPEPAPFGSMPPGGVQPGAMPGAYGSMPPGAGGAPGGTMAYGTPPPGYQGAMPAGAVPPPGQYGGPAAPPPGYGAPPAAMPYQGGASGEYLPAIGRTLASPGIRVLAKFIDVFIPTVISMIFSAIVLASMFSTTDLSGDMSGDSPTLPFLSAGTSIGIIAGSFVLGAVLWFLLDVVMVAKFGGSIGKLICGLRIVRTDGSAMTISSAAKRASIQGALLVVAVVPVVNLVGSFARLGVAIANLVMIFNLDRSRRDVYDMIGDTYVVTKA